MNHHHHHQKHKNTFFLLAGIITIILLVNSPYFASLNHLISQFPYVLALISGILFASTFTTFAGSLIIIQLSLIINPFLLVGLAAFGALSFDIFMYTFFKKQITSEIKFIYQELEHHDHLKKIAHTKYFAWTLPVIGAFIIASPLPDELGISLLGLSRIRPNRFLLISFCSHLFGISCIIMGSRLL